MTAAVASQLKAIYVDNVSWPTIVFMLTPKSGLVEN